MHAWQNDVLIPFASYDPQPGDRVRHTMRGFGTVGQDVSDYQYCHFHPDANPEDFAYVRKENLALEH